VTVVLLTTVLPRGRRSGGEVVSQSVVAALDSAGRNTRVVGYQRPEDRCSTAAGELSAGRRPIETATAGLHGLAWMARAVATRAPYSSAKYESRAYLRAVRQALGHDATAVIADHAQVHFAIRRGGVDRAGENRLPLVFIAHNAESCLYGRLAAAARGPAGRWAYGREARLVRRIEADLAGRARQVWALTAEDADYFRSLQPTADVRPLDVASTMRSEAAAPEYDVALMGRWSWRPNALGLEWLEREVLPRLPADLTIEVAGGGADWLSGRYSNVAIRGVVPDAQSFLSRARVVAVPAVTTSGVQVKTLDAIASGVPVVATRAGVRGLADLPASVTVADDAGDFADELQRLASGEARDSLRAEASAWSNARRGRFESTVASWMAEVMSEDDHGHHPSSVGDGGARRRR